MSYTPSWVMGKKKGSKAYCAEKLFLVSDSDMERRNISIVSKGRFAPSLLSPHLKVEYIISTNLWLLSLMVREGS